LPAIPLIVINLRTDRRELYCGASRGSRHSLSLFTASIEHDAARSGCLHSIAQQSVDSAFQNA
jgi:hypothetical protein